MLPPCFLGENGGTGVEKGDKSYSVLKSSLANLILAGTDRSTSLCSTICKLVFFNSSAYCSFVVNEIGEISSQLTNTEGLQV